MSRGRRARGDIDPKREVIPDKLKSPSKRRKARNRPDPHPAVKAAEADTLGVIEKMPFPPGVMFEPEGEHGYRLTSVHNDIDLWEKQVAVAFGTRSTSACKVFFRELKKLCRKDWDEGERRWKRDETELNAALAMIADWQPANTAQASLAAQMVATHWMVMRLSAQALNNGYMVMEKEAALASKLSRTFAAQCETMLLLQGKRVPVRQTIRVEKTLRQEVHYHDHRAGGVEETDGQCDAKPIDGGELENETAGRIADLREVPGDNEGGEVVPLASRRR